MIIRLLTGLALMLILNLFPAPTMAQISLGGGSSEPESVTLPDPLTPDAIRALVATMSDDQVRGMLLERLDAVALAETEAGANQSLAEGLGHLWAAFTSSTIRSVEKLPILLSRQSDAFAQLGKFYGTKGLAILFGLLALSIVAGLIAERLTLLLTRRWNQPRPTDDNSGLMAAIGVLFRRFLFDIVGLIAFYVVMTVTGLILFSDAQLSFAAPLTIFLIFIPRVAAAYRAWRPRSGG